MNDDLFSNNIAQPDTVVVNTPPLYLPIDDSIILQTLNEAERNARTVRAKLNIDKRSEECRKFWKGEQVDGSKLDARYQIMHVDNVVRQDLENKIKLATGHVPDIFASPPDNQGFNREASNDLQSLLRDRFSGGVTKRLLKNGLRKLDLDFIAILKVRYDKEQQKACYELLDSKNVLFGEGSKVYEDGFTIDGTDILFHYVEEATQQVLNKFPKKANELMALLAASHKTIPSRIIYTEAHFKWYDQQGKAHEGVSWRYQNVLLDKMRQPYYDYDNEQVNFFDRPRKPFILISYTNLGESVYETTTDVEQTIPINRIINKRRRQITEIADRSVPKLAFMGGAMTAEMARNISPSSQEAIILTDQYSETGIDKAMAIIPATPPNPILYNDMTDLRGRIDSVFATHGTTRGESGGSNQSGVSKQISREGDLVTSDDISSFVLERVIYELASWEMQMLRLFHDDDRKPLRITNTEGETEFIEMTRKKVETDIQVVVVASSTDKQTRRADALQLLEAQAIDPYTLLEDLDVPNPRERMRRLKAFIEATKSGNLDAYMEVIGVDPKTPFASEDDAKRDLDILRSGNTVQLRMPDEKYVSVFTSLVKSPEYTDPQMSQEQGWTEYAKSLVANHIKRMKTLVDAEAEKQQQQGGMDSQGLNPGEPQGMPQTAAALTGGQPQPGGLGQAASSVLASRMQPGATQPPAPQA